MVVGLAGFWSGAALLQQVAGLVKDPALEKALHAGAQGLVSLHKERRQHFADLIAACVRSGRWPSCDFAGVNAKITKFPAASESTGWQDEKTFHLEKDSVWYKIDFPWDEIKPVYEHINDTIATRVHLDNLLPEITRSFSFVFAGALILSGCLGLMVTIFLGRKLTRRVSGLVSYTQQIGRGDLAPAPEETRGNDELGALADAMHNMARSLALAQEKLVYAEKMGSWQAVARKVAHEIKNPLTPLSLVADEIERRATSAPETVRGFLQESAHIVREETSSLARMVREFSAFARLPDPQFAACDFVEVVADFVKRNESASGPALILAACNERLPLQADRSMLHQIFHNLVNNARLAKIPERAQIQFRLHKLAAGVAVLDVYDNGPGIPASIRQTLFDAYVTTRSTGEQERGMGLGLTIARKIAADHQGTLVLHETGSDGSCFRLILPISRFDYEN